MRRVVSHTNESCHAHGQVMYRPLIIGTTRPKDATRGASAKDTLSPTPPVECCSRSVCVGERECVCVCMCMCVCACVCVCMCMCVCERGASAKDTLSPTPPVECCPPSVCIGVCVCVCVCVRVTSIKDSLSPAPPVECYPHSVCVGVCVCVCAFVSIGV